MTIVENFARKVLCATALVVGLGTAFLTTPAIAQDADCNK